MAKSKRKAAIKKNVGSLLSLEAMGGIVAGKGFDFQTRYAACHLPIWLLDSSFEQLLFEGTGDLDIRFRVTGRSSRQHIQVKDHEVAPVEFKKVIEHFNNLNQALPGIYTRFTLACPSLSPTLRSIESGLARIRGAKPFYDDVPEALAPTLNDFNDLLRKRNLGHLIDVIHEKVYVDIGHGDLCHDDRAVELFVARLLQHPEFADRLRSMVQPAFSKLMNTITSSKGTALSRGDIEDVLRSAVLSALSNRGSVVIWIQNWTKEAFTPAADYALDWTDFFERATRKVPAPTIWNDELLPQLRELQQRILSERTERKIIFRGKCALSTGLALGSMFPSVGGWTFQIPQPPSEEEWNSDVSMAIPYDLHSEFIDGDLEGNDLVVALNIKGDGRGDVLRYIESSEKRPRLFAFFSPPQQGTSAIGGASDAVAYANAVRDGLGKLLKIHQLQKTRLFYYGPFALAVFLGQKLTSVGEVQLFEYQEPGYVPSFKLIT